jgi:hypothetical protein
MSTRTRLTAVTVSAVLTAALVAVPATSAQARVVAGSLVYSKGGNIHLAHADGTHDIIFKSGGGNGWYWPSMDDQGRIAAERQDRVAPDGTTGYTVHRFRQSGTQLSRQNTPSALSPIACPIYPSYHVSLSPDGTKLAFDYSDCTGNFAAWTPATSFNLHTHSDYYAPSWLSNAAMTISHVGVTFSDTQAEVGTFTTAGGGTGWSTDLADSWAMAYHATATRDGRKIALIEDDGANWIDGVPRNVRLVLATSAGPGQPITRQCSVALNASSYADWYGVQYANLSFRPDGNLLVWDSPVGIFKASTGALAGCTATTLNKQLWIRGGINPSFSPATDTRG